MLKYIFVKKYKEYKDRRAKKIYDELIAFYDYEPHGGIIPLKMSSGRFAKYEIIGWLEYSEPGIKYANLKEVECAFIGYINEKSIYEMTFVEFLDLKKRMKFVKDFIFPKKICKQKTRKN